jgi:hypothetical protein
MLKPAVLLGAVLLLAACGGSNHGTASLPTGSEPFDLDPANFTTQIDTPYFPMSPGSHWVYREAEGGETQRVDVTVTDRTKRISGIEARVVHDLVSRNGEKLEDTFDWYAQDKEGNLWYLGEETKEFENGKVTSTAGSWEAGVDGALAGVIIPADPKQGLTYREEYYKGQAEDGAEVLAVDAKVEVPFGKFSDALMTRNFSTIEPNVLELKFYAKGVGPVMELLVSGGSGRTELVSFDK